MSQRKYLLLAIVLTLCGFLIFLKELGGDGGGGTVSSDGASEAAPPVRTRSDQDGRQPLRRRVSNRSEVSELRNELERTKSELESLSTPLNEEGILSSAVNAVVGRGESLVTGGYKLSDGRYELTFITPKAVDLEGEASGLKRVIKIEARSMVVNDAFVENSGLGTLATNVRNTLQHAETWTGDDVFNTFKSASEAEGVDMSATPTVTTRPNEVFKVEMLDDEGKGYTLRGEANFLADGSFAVKARTQRRE